MRRWKYLVEINLGIEEGEQSLDDALDEAGSGGWELVSVTPVLAKSGVTNILYIFKQPVV